MNAGGHLAQVTRWIGLVLACLSFGGCQTAERLTLDAASRPEKAKPASYRLVVAHPENEGDSLWRQETERLVKAALAGNGYHEAADAAQADLVIGVDYGIDQGHTERFTVGEPMVSGAAGNSIRDAGIVSGMRWTTKTETIYTKRLVLDARRARSDEPGKVPEELFNLEVQSRGGSDDLRAVLPLLAAVALEHLGEDTHGPKVIKLTDTQAVAMVKKLAGLP